MKRDNPTKTDFSSSLPTQESTTRLEQASSTMAFGFDPLSEGMERCPFLHRLAETEGETFARNFATNPFRPAEGTGVRKPVFEELEDFSTTFQVFHGPLGLVPLHIDQNRRQERAAGGLDSVVAARAPSLAQTKKAPVPYLAPAASLSLSNFNLLKGIGQLFKKQDKKQKKPRDSRRNGHKGQASTTTTSKSMNLSIARTPESGGGQCPMRQVFGPIGAMIVSGRYKCPPAIVQMRAMLARTEVVRSLRPESLPVKILAVMAISAALNIPFGAMREHCRKFSPEWFLLVHATIPFIAMFRKTVIMPKYAILFTVAAAVGGQMVGSRLERQRVKGASIGIHSSHKSEQECQSYLGLQATHVSKSIPLVQDPHPCSSASSTYFVSTSVATPVAQN